LTLLNNQVIKLDNEALVIADDKQALALAGIMGGNDSAVNDETQSVFLECAFFAPQSIAGKARRFGLHTDSSIVSNVVLTLLCKQGPLNERHN